MRNDATDSFFCESTNFLGRDPWTYVWFGAREVRLLTIALALQNTKEKGEDRREEQKALQIW